MSDSFRFSFFISYVAGVVRVAWRLSGVYLEGVWKVSERCLEGVWGLSMWCLGVSEECPINPVNSPNICFIF